VIGLAIVAGLMGVVARAAIGRMAARGRVDHYYWMLAAEAYRTQRTLPVRIANKYLMEPEEQWYPPLFGWLLGRWRLDRWGLTTIILLELLQLSVIAALMGAVDAPMPAIALGLATYVAAPVLVTYNTQLNARVLGDVFLLALFAAEATAVFVDPRAPIAFGLWSAAALLTALVVMSHKMTLQLYLVLLAPWSWALASPWPLVAFLAGIGIYVALVGPAFAQYQARAHWDIVSFWNRHWAWIGGHQFRDSPIYGAAGRVHPGCFHAPGLRGILSRLRVVLSYAPFHLGLPAASLITGAWPPAWLLVWLGVIYLWAFATLFVPRLRCLGGGHLYIFNAIGPGACYVAWLPDTPVTLFVLAGGVLLTGYSLFMAWRIVRARPAARDDMFHEALSAVAALPKGRVAVFPLQSAEVVAWETHHAVLWGGHGYGFRQLEGFYPVLTQPLSGFLRKYQIDWVLSDDRFWPLGSESLGREGVRVGAQSTFGHWRVTELLREAC
jgi:hypothetical protein